MKKSLSLSLSLSLLILCLIYLPTFAMKLTSPVFETGQIIPIEYSCDGANISPPLKWQDIPANTQTFTLIMDDPDSSRGTWDHWLVVNLPMATNELKKDIKIYPQGTVLGKNSYGKTSYNGPCPPGGQHRYFFKLYALDKKLDLTEGASKQSIIIAMQGHILAEASLMGTYDRKRAL